MACLEKGSDQRSNYSLPRKPCRFDAKGRSPMEVHLRPSGCRPAMQTFGGDTNGMKSRSRWRRSETETLNLAHGTFNYRRRGSASHAAERLRRIESGVCWCSPYAPRCYIQPDRFHVFVITKTWKYALMEGGDQIKDPSCVNNSYGEAVAVHRRK